MNEKKLSETLLQSNFFELFDVPVSYQLDLQQVKQRYMKLQSQVHPDKFANAGDAEKRLSMQYTSRLNEAVQTLQDPVLRASYLLKLKGLDINLENETTMDAAFLMEQLELRETMENIKEKSASDGDDPESSLVQLDEIRRGIKKNIQSTMISFAEAWEADDLDIAREWVRKLQFLQKAVREVETLSADIEDQQMSAGR